jgi:hypothetical protein
MSARVVLAVAVAFATAPAFADEQKVTPLVKTAPVALQKSASGGGHSSGGARSSGATARHSGGRPGGSGHASGGGHSRSDGGQRSHGGGGGYARPLTGAQARHPRPGTGTGSFDNGHHGGHGGYYGGYGYRYPGYGYPGYGYGYGYGYPGYAYGGYYGSRYGFGFGWGSPYYGGYGYYSPYSYWYAPAYYAGYYGASYDHDHDDDHDSGAIRLLIEPSKARVYVDGYYSGIVDDYDGAFQKLNLTPGRHEITLKLEGYRTQHFRVHVPAGDTIKIHYDMVRGGGEATSDEFAGPSREDQARIEDMTDREAPSHDERSYAPREREAEPVRLRVSPRDASVYVDGEFAGTGREASQLRLRPGRHRIEVVRPGYRTIEREIDVQSGDAEDVEVALEKN